jgi:hypothetical protein
MKRLKFLLVGAFIVALLVIWLVARPSSGPSAARFVPGTPATLAAFKWADYGWNAGIPFTEDKVWFWTLGDRTNRPPFHVYLYDLERRAIVGELQNGSSPILWQRDHSQVLFTGPDSDAMALKHKLLNWVRSWRKAAPMRSETWWVLDTRSNAVRRVGTTEQFSGSGSGWSSSPSSRYGFTVPTTLLGRGIVVYDFDSNSSWTIPSTGQPRGWWADQEILLESADNTFVALDIHSRQTRPLFAPATFASVLAQAGLTNPSAGISAFANWNGREYDFYFGIKGRISGTHEPNSFLLKAERNGPAPSLKLAYRDFEFHWGGHLDAAGTHYLFQGESGKPGKGGDGAVYWRDLTTNTTVTLVPPDHKGQYAIPRLYGDQVIYFKDRLLRRVNVDGSHDGPLLP